MNLKPGGDEYVNDPCINVSILFALYFHLAFCICESYFSNV